MADIAFEQQLDRLFAQAPVFRDADLFALRLDERLDRGWTARRFLIGGLGLIGGLIGGAQIVGSHLFSRFAALSAHTDRLVSSDLSQVAPFNLLPAGFAINGEVLWMSAALGAVAIGFGVARAIRDI